MGEPGFKDDRQHRRHRRQGTSFGFYSNSNRESTRMNPHPILGRRYLVLAGDVGVDGVDP
jgi:hypothetical protein